MVSFVLFEWFKLIFFTISLLSYFLESLCLVFFDLFPFMHKIVFNIYYELKSYQIHIMIIFNGKFTNTYFDYFCLHYSSLIFLYKEIFNIKDSFLLISFECNTYYNIFKHCIFFISLNVIGLWLSVFLFYNYNLGILNCVELMKYALCCWSFWRSNKCV